MPRVAIIEDHKRLAEMVRESLAIAGIEADLFSTTSQAIFGLDQDDYAVLIIDRGLPDGDGLALLQRLRSDGRSTPCLMLTARDALHDRIDGLESGVDDYVTKPFALSELVARVRTLLRIPTSLTVLEASFGDVSIDPRRRQLNCGDRRTPLAAVELQIMVCLIEAQGRVVRQSSLEQAGWGLLESVTPNALEVSVHRLRKKLAEVGSSIRLTNIRGAGFALQAA